MRCDQMAGEEEKEAKPVPVPTTPDSPDRPTKYPEEDEDSQVIRLMADNKRTDSECSEAEDRNSPAATGELPVAGQSVQEDEDKGENDEHPKKKNRDPPPSRHPDGGYGWVIVFAAILQQVSTPCSCIK